MVANSIDSPLLDKIPAFPPVVLQVMQILDREDVNLAHLSDTVSTDAAFAANILRYANSPLFGLLSTLDDVGAAIQVIGLDRLRSLAVTIITGNYMRAAFRIGELRRCWRHSLATAVVAARLGPAFKQATETCYTAGLLHDLGRLGLLVGYPERYTQIMRRAGRNSVELLDLEQHEFGMDHCAAGRLLAEKWSLPQDLVIVAGRHHDPEPDPEQPLLSLVHSACAMADALGYYVIEPLQPETFEQLCDRLPEDARRQFSISPRELQDEIDDVIRKHDDEDFQVGNSPARTTIVTTEIQAAPKAASYRITAWDAAVVAATCAMFVLAYLAVSYISR